MQSAHIFSINSNLHLPNTALSRQTATRRWDILDSVRHPLPCALQPPSFTSCTHSIPHIPCHRLCFAQRSHLSSLGRIYNSTWPHAFHLQVLIQRAICCLVYYNHHPLPCALDSVCHLLLLYYNRHPLPRALDSAHHLLLLYYNHHPLPRILRVSFSPVAQAWWILPYLTLSPDSACSTLPCAL